MLYKQSTFVFLQEQALHKVDTSPLRKRTKINTLKTTHSIHSVSDHIPTVQLETNCVNQRENTFVKEICTLFYKPDLL